MCIESENERQQRFLEEKTEERIVYALNLPTKEQRRVHCQLLHVSKSSNVMNHCSQYALSTDSKEFAKECEHVHDQDCLSCEVLQNALMKISDAVTSQVTYETDDQKDEILYIVNQSKKAIHEWKMHILRTYNQGLARSDAMENLGDDEILIERDWAMKFVPMMYR